MPETESVNQRESVLSHSDYSNNLGTDQRLHPVVDKHLGVFPADDCSQIAPASDGGDFFRSTRLHIRVF